MRIRIDLKNNPLLNFVRRYRVTVILWVVGLILWAVLEWILRTKGVLFFSSFLSMIWLQYIPWVGDLMPLLLAIATIPAFTLDLYLNEKTYGAGYFKFARQIVLLPVFAVVFVLYVLTFQYHFSFLFDLFYARFENLNISVLGSCFTPWIIFIIVMVILNRLLLVGKDLLIIRNSANKQFNGSYVLKGKINKLRVKVSLLSLTDVPALLFNKAARKNLVMQKLKVKIKPLQGKAVVCDFDNYAALRSLNNSKKSRASANITFYEIQELWDDEILQEGSYEVEVTYSGQHKYSLRIYGK